MGRGRGVRAACAAAWLVARGASGTRAGGMRQEKNAPLKYPHTPTHTPTPKSGALTVPTPNTPNHKHTSRMGAPISLVSWVNQLWFAGRAGGVCKGRGLRCAWHVRAAGQPKAGQGGASGALVPGYRSLPCAHPLLRHLTSQARLPPPYPYPAPAALDKWHRHHELVPATSPSTPTIPHPMSKCAAHLLPLTMLGTAPMSLSQPRRIFWNRPSAFFSARAIFSCTLLVVLRGGEGGHREPGVCGVSGAGPRCRSLPRRTHLQGSRPPPAP